MSSTSCRDNSSGFETIRQFETDTGENELVTPSLTPKSNNTAPPPSPGTRAAAELQEMYKNSPPTHGRLSTQAKLAILTEKDNDTIERTEPRVSTSVPPPFNLQINLSASSNPPDFPSSSNTPLSQKGKQHSGSMEALGPIAQEVETIGAYLRQALLLKKIDILKEAKQKADTLLAKPEYIAAKDRLKTLDPNDPAVETTLHSIDQLMKTYASFEPEIKRLSNESVDIIKYYLKQGVLTRNRDMIKEALLRLTQVNRALIEKSLLGPAEELIKELDAQHITIQYLTSAISAKDLTALEDAINKARLLNMREEDFKELADAIKVQTKLREKNEKENSRRVADFVTKFFKNKGDKSDKRGDSVQSKTEKSLFGSELIDVTETYSRAVPAHPEFTSSDTKGEEKVDVLTANVPIIVADCMDYILQHSGRDEPGIFRLAGNRDIMAQIVSEYDAHFQIVSQNTLSNLGTSEIPPSPVSQLNDVNDAANILKQFLRALPEPLIPFTAYSEWIALGQKLRQNESEEHVLALKTLCSKLPVQCHDLLQYLAFHLSYITKNSDVNKMTENNLAIVFAPNLLRPKEETSQTLISDSPVTILLISLVIKYATKLF